MSDLDDFLTPTLTRQLEFELVAAGASGDLAYTLGYEHVVFSIDGGPVAPLTLRVTHLYRREDGEWKTIHRHADAPQPPAACWCARAIVASTLTSQVISPAASPGVAGR